MTTPRRYLRPPLSLRRASRPPGILREENDLKRNKKRKDSKRRGQIIHCRKRAWQRLDLCISADDIRHIVGLIKRCESLPLHSPSCRVRFHQIEYRGKTMVVLYDKQRSNLATIMTREMYDKTYDAKDIS